MTDHNLDHLCPELKTKAEKCLSDWFMAYPDRLPVKILVTWRSGVDQNAAKAAGLSNCKAGESKHNCCTPDGEPASRAFDFGCFDESDGSYITDGTDGYYADFGDIAKANNLKWGGDWTGFKDFDHCELPD